MDRFQPPTPAEEPTEVCLCEACDEMMYDYEVVKCPCCDFRVHKNCITKCSLCQTEGCLDCIPQDKDLEPVCKVCLEQREADYKAAVEHYKCNVREGYYYAGLTIKDNRTIIEHLPTTSKAGPIRIYVYKTKGE